MTSILGTAWNARCGAVCALAVASIGARLIPAPCRCCWRVPIGNSSVLKLMRMGCDQLCPCDRAMSLGGRDKSRPYRRISMISVEEALERILAEIMPLDVVQVPLAESLGQVLAQEVIAQEDMPPFANSAMDGFALLSKDSQQRGG